MANNKKDFIENLANLVSKYASESNKDTDISTITAYGAICSSFGTKSRTKNANNIFGIVIDDSDTNAEYFQTPGGADDTKYKIYESIEESVKDFMLNHSIDINIDDNMEKVISTYNLISYDEKSKFIPSEPTIKEEEVEEETVESEVEEVKEEIIPSNTSKNEVDVIDSNSKIDKFFIRKDNENLAVYPNTLEEAIEICNKYPGYSVSNSKGITLYTSPIPTPAPDIKQNCLYRKGRKFKAKSMALYINPNDKTIYRTITGTLVIYDGIERNGRYRVCKPDDLKNKSRNVILGWVDKCNIV